MLKPKSIGVLLRDKVQEYPLENIRAFCQKLGAQYFVLNDGLPREKLDLVIAMGGDGTVLRALDMVPDCPVLAVNFGTVGFLTAGDRGDIDHLLSRLLAGDFAISERILLRCEFAEKTVHAVNEVILRVTGRIIEVDVYVNETEIRTIRGDGVIVGTPTGSTGYLLSTGAPLVMPEVNCFVLDGINEYNFSSRALIISPKSHVRLTVRSLQKNEEALVVVDGKQVGKLATGGEIVLHRSERRAQLIFFDENYFFHNLTSRLSWI